MADDDEKVGRNRALMFPMPTAGIEMSDEDVDDFAEALYRVLMESLDDE